MSRMLVTGGAGYIGSHMCVELLQAGHEVAIVDNLVNSSERAVRAIEMVTQRSVRFHELDLRDTPALEGVFAEFEPEAVFHFAGLKAVGESVANPALYFDNNLNGTLSLVNCMRAAGTRTLVFSSSATVYGSAACVPIRETSATSPINPYGRTKLFAEELLKDLCGADPEWRVSLLRYFNPVGAHASGELGEDPNGIPNNLVPYVSQVAAGKLPHLNVFGDDYPTPDGTGVRDYIHVCDLVHGHLKALEFLENHTGAHVHNLGTGRGYSVYEVVRAFERASGRPVPCRVTPRRPGDSAVSYADPAKAHADLGWRAELGIERMCEDVWRWQTRHPNGFH